MSGDISVPEHSGDYMFYREVSLHLGSSLDFKKNMLETFDFLKKYFPIDAISLHQHIPSLNALVLLFLVQKDRVDFVGKQVMLDKDIFVTVPPEGEDNILLSVRNCFKNRTTFAHASALASYIPLKERAYFIGMLQKNREERLGHLCFIGNSVGCFKPEHEKKFRMLIEPFSQAMANMLQFKEVSDFHTRLEKENKKLKSVVNTYKSQTIVGEKSGLKDVFEAVNQLKGQEIPVLIQGETGTGKELVASAIQKTSPRKNMPFVTVNCGAIPDTLIDSELFGYEKGAFTGAAKSKPGRFELANHGTLFLDEIGELPMPAQVRLLRVLQNGIVERVGGVASIKVDVRIIAATNRNLEQMLKKGAFREDLYYRLKVFPIYIKPLRERKQDIPALLYHFIQQSSKRHNLQFYPDIPIESHERLQAYSWPGNIRELENLVEQALTLFPPVTPGKVLEIDKLLPQDAGWYLNEKNNDDYFLNLIDGRIKNFMEHTEIKNKNELMTLEEATKNCILNALDATHWRINGAGGAAEILGINPNTLRGKMRKLKLL